MNKKRWARRGVWHPGMKGKIPTDSLSQAVFARYADRAASLYRRGLTVAGVAAKLGVTTSIVHSMLNKAGLKRRKQGRPGKLNAKTE